MCNLVRSNKMEEEDKKYEQDIVNASLEIKNI